MNQTNPSASPPNGISKLHPTPACSILTVRSLPRPAGSGTAAASALQPAAAPAPRSPPLGAARELSLRKPDRFLLNYPLSRAILFQN